MQQFVQALLYSCPALLFVGAAVYYYRKDLVEAYINYQVAEEEKSERNRPASQCRFDGDWIVYTHPQRSRHHEYRVYSVFVVEEDIEQYMQKENLSFSAPLSIMSCMVTYEDNPYEEPLDEIETLQSLYGPEGDWHYGMFTNKYDGYDYLRCLSSKNFSDLFPGCTSIMITDMTEDGDIRMVEKDPNDKLYFVKEYFDLVVDSDDDDAQENNDAFAEIHDDAQENNDAFAEIHDDE